MGIVAIDNPLKKYPNIFDKKKGKWSGYEENIFDKRTT